MPSKNMAQASEIQGPNLAVAAHHIELLTGSPDTEICLRLIHDSDKGKGARPNLTGSLDQLWPEIAAAQKAGYGVFLVVNEGGHRGEDITRVRAAFVDADDVPMPTEWHVPPEFTVQRDPTHWHAYWPMSDLPPERFTEVQKRLAAHYGTDPAVCDLPRVMRLAGTLHLKDPAAPRAVTLEDHSMGFPLQHDTTALTAGLAALPAAQMASATVDRGAHEPATREQIEAMLRCIDPGEDDGNRTPWRNTLAGLRAIWSEAELPEDEGLELAQRWSAGNWARGDGSVPAGYTSDEDVAKVWETMKPKPRGIGPGSFIQIARQAGYTGPATARAGMNGPAQGRRERFRLILPSEMRVLPEPSYAVDQLVPEQGLVLLYGPAASLKTFLVLDILASTAAGIPAFGRLKTHQGPAVLCAGESPFGVARLRWPAFAKSREIARPDDVPFAIVPAVPLVSDKVQIDELIAAIHAADLKPKIIAVDTVARAMAGLPENEAQAAGLMVSSAERLRDEFGCAVVMVHHSGKNEDHGPRGSSALGAGVDTIVRVARVKDQLAATLHFEKMKDADEPPTIHLMGSVVDGSIAFREVHPDEFAASTRANPPLSPSVVGTALKRAGAMLTTYQLAVTLCEPGADEKDIGNMERRLRAAAKTTLAAYVAVPASGRGTTIKWAFPDLTEDAA